MMRAVQRRAIEMQIEVAVVRRQFHDLLRLDQFFLEASVRDQALDRADAQPVFFAELHQFRQTRHGPVVVQNFAENAGRLEPRHPRQIDRRFRMARPA